MENFHKIIKEICLENKIDLKILSKGWICYLEREQQIRYIVGYKFDLNSHGIGEILDDKYAFYELLLEKKYPSIEYHIIFRETEKEHIEKLFDRYYQNVVLKSNTGTCGREVFHIKKKEQLLECIDRLLKKHFSISLCPFYEIQFEYRVIILDGKTKIIYGKKKPIVIGDGKSSIKQLLEKQNPFFFKNIDLPSELNRILPENDIYEYHWQFNLSQGASLFEVKDNDLKEKLSQLAESIAKDFGMTFCSIDIIQTKEDQLLVMEANSGVMMDQFIKQYPNGYEVAKNIYKEAIDKMFS